MGIYYHKEEHAPQELQGYVSENRKDEVTGLWK